MNKAVDCTHRPAGTASRKQDPVNVTAVPKKLPAPPPKTPREPRPVDDLKAVEEFEAKKEAAKKAATEHGANEAEVEEVAEPKGSFKPKKGSRR